MFSNLKPAFLPLFFHILSPFFVNALYLLFIYFFPPAMLVTLAAAAVLASCAFSQ
jgi:hypothetical protein